jgi:hypothetical protein
MSFEKLSQIGVLFSGVAAFVGIGIAWFQLRGMKKTLEHSNLMSVFEIEFEMGGKKNVMQMPGNMFWMFLTAGRKTD